MEQRRLGRWLRVVGFDAVFLDDSDEDKLIRTGVWENRIVLARERSVRWVDDGGCVAVRRWGCSRTVCTRPFGRLVRGRRAVLLST